MSRYPASDFIATSPIPLAADRKGLSRRQLLGAAALMPLIHSLPVRADDTGPIKLAQSIALTAADDGYDVKRALANVTGFLADRSNFALFNCRGTPMVEAMLPQAIESGVPFFAPFSGALSVRPKNIRNVFNIRASYAEEVEQLVQHLATVGIKRIAIVYQNNSFGKEVFNATQTAMARYNMAARAVAQWRTILRTQQMQRPNLPLPIALGGYAVSFNESLLNASHFVELTMVARDGRFIR